YVFLGAPVHEWDWAPPVQVPGAPSDLGGMTEISYRDTELKVFHQGKTFFAYPGKTYERKLQAATPYPDPNSFSWGKAYGLVKSLSPFGASGPLVMPMRFTTNIFDKVDPYGNIGFQEVVTAGVDLDNTTYRTFVTDETTWRVADVQTVQECS